MNLIKNAITPDICEVILANCVQQYNAFVTDNPIFKYPERKDNFFFPGTTVIGFEEYYDLLTSGESHKFDLGEGTGTNFINLQIGESLGFHIDKPLFQINDYYTPTNIVNDKYCKQTIILCLRNTSSTCEVIEYEDMNVIATSTRIESGDIMIIDGFTPNGLSNVTDGTFEALYLYLCSPINTTT